VTATADAEGTLTDGSSSAPATIPIGRLLGQLCHSDRFSGFEQLIETSDIFSTPGMRHEL